MKYYLGTKSECEAYDTKVTAGEEYVPGTYNWANARETATAGVYAIAAHSSYSPDDNMTLQDFENINWPQTETP